MSTNIVVPELGESVVEARVAKWLKQQGDSVNAGDPLVELETEKIDLEVSADRAGVLANIKHQEGADVKVGEVLAILEEASGAGGPRFRGFRGFQTFHGFQRFQGFHGFQRFQGFHGFQRFRRVRFRPGFRVLRRRRRRRPQRMLRAIRRLILAAWKDRVPVGE
jgi:pyruvate/2-oxoglutarate dehydrogenase complex dihydrolipoamide acyltransferase (E2) component